MPQPEGNGGFPTDEEAVAMQVLILEGIDAVIEELASLASRDGRPTVALAAGWVSGMALTERERLKGVRDAAVADRQ